MRWRNTLLLLAVLALLGGLVWLSNRREGEKKEAEEQAKKLYGALEANQIEGFTLTTTDGKTATVARVEGAWRVTEPVDFPADAATADGVASALAGMQSEAAIEEPQPPEVYGLGEGARELRFQAAGAERVLRIGKKTPVGANSYVSNGEAGKVYSVATYRTTGLERTLDDLRERRPIRFERGDVGRIEASWAGGGVVLEQRDGKWRLVEPLEGDADEDTIETLLSDLVFLRAAGFVDEPPPDAETGLDEPQYRVALVGKPAKEGEAPPRWELAIGGVIEANARAGRGAEKALYKIPEDRFQKLPNTVTDFRFKELASYEASDAQRFEIVLHDAEAAKAGTSGAVTITGERQADGWTTSPEPMAAGSAARLVAELARFRGVDIAAEQVGASELAGLGLAPPNAAIRVFGKPADPEGSAEAGGEAPVLADLQIGVQQGDRFAAKRADRDTIFLFPASAGEHVPVSLDAFRNRFVSKEEPAPADAEGGGPAPEEGADEEPAAGGGAADEGADSVPHAP